MPSYLDEISDCETASNAVKRRGGGVGAPRHWAAGGEWGRKVSVKHVGPRVSATPHLIAVDGPAMTAADERASPAIGAREAPMRKAYWNGLREARDPRDRVNGAQFPRLLRADGQ